MKTYCSLSAPGASLKKKKKKAENAQEGERGRCIQTRLYSSYLSLHSSKLKQSNSNATHNYSHIKLTQPTT